MSEKSDTLESLRATLSSQDYIMEPTVLDTVRKYCGKGGKPPEVIELLSDNYRAMAQHVNLLAEWLILSGMSGDQVQELVENHLQQQLIKHFDPTQADTVFANEGGTPSWLEQMIKYKKWRQLFYQLTEKYPDCTLLNYVIKLVSDAGHQGEITNLSTAAAQLEVFARVIKTSIENLLDENDETILENLPKFCEMVNHSEHTYIFSQSLLDQIKQKSSQNHLIERISQEVELFARTRGYQVDRAWLSSVSGANRYPKALQAITTILNAPNITDEVQSQFITLYKAYRTDDPPPIALIRAPSIIDVFVNFLFIPSSLIALSQPSKDAKRSCVWIFGYAASVIEEWDDRGNRQSIDRQEHEIEQISKAIYQASELLLDKEGSLNIISELQNLFQYIKFPPVGLGVLRWVEYITTPKYLEKQIEGTPLSLALIDEIAICHPQLHNDVMKLLTKLLENNFPAMDTLILLNLKKNVLDRMVHLISRGYVIPILRYISNISKSERIDASLIRHFVTEVLDIIQAPYSDELKEILYPLVQAVHAANPEEELASDFLNQVNKNLFHDSGEGSSQEN